jgi:hypothetical protein
MEAILLGIDGTGVLSNTSYRDDMHNSFVSYIVRRSPATLKRYTRGPAWEGLDMSIIVSNAYSFVHLGLAANPKARIFLAGYSRGGAGVIGVAQLLAKQGAKVNGMVLFDPVDRALGVGAADIPTNVEHVVYARRDPTGASRISFGNCGTRWHAPTRCAMRYFYGTHGSIGGVPWKAPPEKRSSDLINEGIVEPLSSPTKISYGQDARTAQ